MATWHEDRLERFRQLVELDNLPRPDSPEVGVVAEWPKRLEALSERGWEIFFENAWFQAGGAIGEWGLRREREHRSEQLVVKIYVSSLGIGPARRYFRHQAMSSTAPELPYKVEVAGEVVTFFIAASALPEGTSSDSLLRLYRNVVFDVRVSGAETGVVFEVADDLLVFAQEHPDVPLRERRPPIEPAPDVLLSGREIQVRVPAAPDPFDDFRGTSYEVQVQTQGNVDFVGFRGRDATFHKQERPGKGRIRVQAIDRRTLLSRKLDLKIPDVVPR